MAGSCSAAGAHETMVSSVSGRSAGSKGRTLSCGRGNCRVWRSGPSSRPGSGLVRFCFERPTAVERVGSARVFTQSPEPRSRVRAADCVWCHTAVRPERVPHRTWCGRADNRAIRRYAVRSALTVSFYGHACRTGDPPCLARVRRRRATGKSGGGEKRAAYEAHQSHTKHLPYRERTETDH